MDRLYIKDIQKLLSFRDRRTIRKWCINNGIKIFSDMGSNRLYVIKAEFEIALNNKVLMKYLKDKYGEAGLSEILNNDNSFFQSNGTGEQDGMIGYVPKGEHEKNFLKRLQSIL